MNLQGLNLHIENLLPGVVILACLILIDPTGGRRPETLKSIRANEFVFSACFLATAYLLGVTSAVVSRWLLDKLSHKFTRPFVIASTSPFPFEKVAKTLRACGYDIPDRGRKIRDIRVWNAVYFAATAYSTKNGSPDVVKEIVARRVQGRLVRNLLIPAIIGTIAYSRIMGFSPWWAVVSGLIVWFLYSYAEHMIFAEAALHLPPDANTSQKFWSPDAS